MLHDFLPKTPQKSPPHASHTSPLLPPPERQKAVRSSALEVDQYHAGQEIERPRSALHSGDFTEGPLHSSPSQSTILGANPGLYGLERTEWFATSPPRDFSPFSLDPRFPPIDPEDRPRSRALSLSSSLSSSFVLKPPTSPLVQSESNEDLDFTSTLNPIDITPAYQRNPRRHTLQTSNSTYSSPSVPSFSSFNRPLPHLRRDNTFPYQAHQPRRAFTSNHYPPSASPQTPSLLRRPSYTCDSSPLHASMVGSYEESILRGRMSTTPSKPLDFVAQIGVLGLGKCKSNLKCPPHVTIPFPAVFYSYQTTIHGRMGNSADGPSPYVGQIDLENNLPNLDGARDNKRKRHIPPAGSNYVDGIDIVDPPHTNQFTERERRRAEKHKKRSTSPRAPPGGSYRIPEKGQLQIIIKNPNKTAVKLFLIPYDLSGMESGTKTFIRQRIYSAGPIINTALSSSSQVSTPNPLDRPTLRYLVHLHICSPSSGRFYLYKSIRIVFANRVPDGKEKLRSEISLPEPRFTVYKPGRDSVLGLGFSSGAGANLVAEKAYRRRSSGFALGGYLNRNIDVMDGITQALDKGNNNGSTYPYGQLLSATPIHPIPFSLYQKQLGVTNDPSQDRPPISSPTSSNSSRLSTSQSSEMSWNSNRNGNNMSIRAYDKLSKGDVGYGGNVFAGSPDGKQVVAESLLAKKLRDLGVGHLIQQDDTNGV